MTQKYQVLFKMVTLISPSDTLLDWQIFKAFLPLIEKNPEPPGM